MKKMYKLMLVCCLLLISFVIKGEESLAEANGASFGVEPMYPSNQEEGKAGYFSLLMDKGQQQTIKVKVTNYSDKPNKVKVERHRATTADSGLIEYSDGDKEREVSVKQDFNDLVTLNTDTLSIDGNSSKEVEVNISMGQEAFDGTVLGGLYFYEDNELSQKEQEKSIRNTFSYSVPILLKMNQKKVENNLSLNHVLPIERNSRPFIEAQLLNSASAVIKEMSVEGRIYNEKHGEEYYVNKEVDLEMAPHSTLNFGFDLQNAAFIPGDYRILLTVKADGKDYLFEEAFTIDKNQAKELNEKSAYIEVKEFPWLKIGLGVGALVLVSTGTVYYLVGKKKKSQSKKKKRTKKKK